MPSMETLFKAIACLVDSGQHEAAYWAMDKLLADYKDNAKHRNCMADLAYHQSDTETALDHSQKAVRLMPENDDINPIAKRCGHAKPQSPSNNLKGDIHDLGQLLAVSPGDSKAYAEFQKKMVMNLKESEHIQGWLAPAEGFILYSMSLKNNDSEGSILEIGSFMGKSSYWLAKGSKDRNGNKIICVDTFEGSREHRDLLKGHSTFEVFKHNLVKADVFDWVLPVQGASEEAFASSKEKIGLLFIDGSHAYKDVKSDVLNWEQRLNIGGTIILHDSNGQWDGPTKVANELILGRKKNYANFIQVHAMTIAKKIA